MALVDDIRLYERAALVCASPQRLQRLQFSKQGQAEILAVIKGLDSVMDFAGPDQVVPITDFLSQKIIDLLQVNETELGLLSRVWRHIDILRTAYDPKTSDSAAIKIFGMVIKDMPVAIPNRYFYTVAKAQQRLLKRLAAGPQKEDSPRSRVLIGSVSAQLTEKLDLCNKRIAEYEQKSPPRGNYQQLAELVADFLDTYHKTHAQATLRRNNAGSLLQMITEVQIGVRTVDNLQRVIHSFVNDYRKPAARPFALWKDSDMPMDKFLQIPAKNRYGHMLVQLKQNVDQLVQYQQKAVSAVMDESLEAITNSSATVGDLYASLTNLGQALVAHYGTTDQSDLNKAIERDFANYKDKPLPDVGPLSVMMTLAFDLRMANNYRLDSLECNNVNFGVKYLGIGAMALTVALGDKRVAAASPDPEKVIPAVMDEIRDASLHCAASTKMIPPGSVERAGAENMALIEPVDPPAMKLSETIAKLSRGQNLNHNR